MKTGLSVLCQLVEDLLQENMELRHAARMNEATDVEFETNDRATIFNLRKEIVRLMNERDAFKKALDDVKNPIEEIQFLQTVRNSQAGLLSNQIKLISELRKQITTLTGERDELTDWKNQWTATYTPLIDYLMEYPDFKLGDSYSVKIREFLEERLVLLSMHPKDWDNDAEINKAQHRFRGPENENVMVWDFLKKNYLLIPK